jgi:hypothetical protein
LKLPAHVLFRKELSLMVWKPHGILDQALVNEIVAFVEAAEERAQKPFNRFADLSALDAVDLNFRFVFHIALHRRLAFESHPPQDNVLRHEPRHHPLPKIARHVD